MPSDVIEMAAQYLPDTPLVIGGLVGVGALAVGGRRSGRFVARTLARRQADREGYALPMFIRDDRNIKQYEQMGNVVSIPREGSILALGATRSGKTETGKWIVDGMQASEDEPMIVYDHKDDYQQFFEQTGREYIKLSASRSTHTWNIFEEIDRESDADEIARAIFAEVEAAGGSTGAFFGPAARQVFAVVLKYLHRQAQATDQEYSNRDVIEFFQTNTPQQAHAMLVDEEDMAGIAIYLDPADDEQDVWSNVQRQVTDVFTSDFATEPSAEQPAISIHEYMQHPRGNALVLDYPYREGSTTTPIFRLLIDLAAREALVDGERGSYFVLDEIAQVPNLQRLDELVNVGAGRNIQVFLTLQSVAQLRAGYGEEEASAILSGLTSTILLRCDDPKSVEYVRAKIGREMNQYTAHVEKAQLPRHRQKTMRREHQPREEHVFAESEINSWDPGEGVLVRPDSWAYGRVKLYDS
jgi:type IV secretory pathway TraG/TraD family ATPase VirD4